MIDVILAQRKSAVLTPSSLACLADVATINLTLGCAHSCRYCYARGYSTYPGDGRVVLYNNTLEKLRQELSRKRKRPHAVYFSPSCDLFQPVPQVLKLGYQVLDYLLQEGIGVSFLTKGMIPPEHFALLCRHAAQVRAQIGITTLTLISPAALNLALQHLKSGSSNRTAYFRGHCDTCSLEPDFSWCYR